MSDIKRKSDLETTYTKGQLRKDMFFGDFYIYNSIGGSGNPQIICVEKIFNDKESILREIEAKKKRILNKNEYLVNLLDYSVEVQTNWCSTFYLLKCFYEYMDKNLTGEIIDRKKINGDKNRFKMEELTHLMYQQVHANAFLQERGIYHGDICPNTIFVSPKGEYKLAFRMNDLMTPERVQVDKAIKNEPLYLAPAFYEAVKQRSLDRMKHNQYKSDMFALGLTILQAGVMKTIQGIYVGDKFDQRVLEELLLEFETNYEDNPLLYTSISKMCELNEDERPDFLNLKSALPEYSTIKDYFQKVEAGIYEDDAPDEFVGTNDSMQNYNPNLGYDIDPRTGHPVQQGDFNYMDDGHNNYGQQYQPNQQLYPSNNMVNASPHQNFNRSISNKLSNSSNQNSQNNSFNKQANANQNQAQNLHKNPHIVETPQTTFVSGNDYSHQNSNNYGHQVNTVHSEPADDFFGGDFFKYTPQNSTINSGVVGYQSLPQDQRYPSVEHEPVHKPQFQQKPQQFQQDFAPTPTYQQNQAQSYQQNQPNPQQQRQVQSIPSQDVYNHQQGNIYPQNVTSEPIIFNRPQQSNVQSTLPPSNQFVQNNYQSVQQYSSPKTSDEHFFGSQPAQANFSGYQQVQTSQPHVTRYQSLSQQSNPTPYTPHYNVSNEAPVERKNSIPVVQNGPTGQTKIFSGTLYNEIREESNVLENGVMVKKVILKYVQAENQAPQQVTRVAPQSSEGYYGGNYIQTHPATVQYR